jgi:leucyl-tRNA synthetase
MTLPEVTDSAEPTPAPGSGAEIPPFRYTAALAGDIERRWQDYWEREGTFNAPNPSGPLAPAEGAVPTEKTYLLDMFPYPSGEGLHVGHPLGYVGTDVLGRFLRMTGRNVLHTIGYDAFGLPAEQYAVRTGTHPRTTTEANVARYRAQLRRLGFAHDRRRSVTTMDPEFYRWTQWIFLQLFNAWFDPAVQQARPDLDAGRPVRHRISACPGRPPLGRVDRAGAAADPGGPSAGLHRRGPGQLVPGPGHGARQ